MRFVYILIVLMAWSLPSNIAAVLCRPGRRSKGAPDLAPVDRSFGGSSVHDAGNISYGAEPEGGLTLSGDHFPGGTGDPKVWNVP